MFIVNDVLHFIDRLLFSGPDIHRLEAKKNVKRLVKATLPMRAYRREAAEALRRIGSPLGVELLIAALDDKSSLKRDGAATALGIIGDPKAILPLKNALDSGKVGSSARLALKDIARLNNMREERSPAKSTPLNTMKSILRTINDQATRKEDFQFLAALAGISLDNKMWFDSKGYPARLPEALAALDRDYAIGLLEEILRGNTPELSAPGLRLVALKALKQSGKNLSVEMLQPALTDMDQELRKDAVMLCKESGMDLNSTTSPILARTIEITLPELDSMNFFTRSDARDILEALNWKPDNDLDTVRFALAKNEWDKAASQGSIAIAPLVAHFKSNQDSNRGLVAQALGKIRDERILAPLVNALREWGQAAPQPLKRNSSVNRHDYQFANQMIIDALFGYINANAASVDTKTLSDIAAIPKDKETVESWSMMDETSDDEYIDCRALKELAKEELERRG